MTTCAHSSSSPCWSHPPNVTHPHWPRAGGFAGLTNVGKEFGDNSLSFSSWDGDVPQGQWDLVPLEAPVGTDLFGRGFVVGTVGFGT